VHGAPTGTSIKLPRTLEQGGGKGKTNLKGDRGERRKGGNWRLENEVE